MSSILVSFSSRGYRFEISKLTASQYGPLTGLAGSTTLDSASSYLICAFSC